MAERDCARYGPDGKRYCPRCGARVAQQADTCLVCHARLDECPSPRHLPLAEGIVLLFVILLAWGWWEGRAARTVLYARRFTVTARQRALVSPSATPTRTPTATRTPTWTPTATPTATPTPQVYKVQPHDTLAGIAAEHGITVQRLARANGLDLGSLLQVGQELVIPGPEGTPYPTPTPTPRAAIVNYVTQKGDTLTLIAERFHVPLEVILKNNRVPNPALLKPGTVLVIPIGTPEPTPTPTPILTPTPTHGTSSIPRRCLFCRGKEPCFKGLMPTSGLPGPRWVSSVPANAIEFSSRLDVRGGRSILTARA